MPQLASQNNNETNDDLSTIKDQQYVLSCYCYKAAETKDSAFIVLGCYKTYDDVEKAMITNSKEMLEVLTDNEKERINDLKKIPLENKNIKVTETEENIFLEKKNGEKISYKKATYKVKEGERGLIVAHFDSNGDEKKFHFGGYASRHDYCMYSISLTSLN